MGFADSYEASKRIITGPGEALTHRVLSRSEEHALLTKCHDGCERSLDTLVAHNMRMVHKVAHSYHRTMRAHVTYDDLVQEGVIGLVTAIKRFDTDSGNKLSTYAMPWIRKYVRELIGRNVSLMHVPRSVFDKAQRKELSEAHAAEYAKATDAHDVDNRIIRRTIADPESVVEYDEYNEPSRVRMRDLFSKADLTPAEATVMVYRTGIFGHRKLDVRACSEETGISQNQVRELLRAGKNKVRALLREQHDGQSRLFD